MKRERGREEGTEEGREEGREGGRKRRENGGKDVLCRSCTTGAS